ncbi:hypothetical protein WJX77_005841 [Trebouxia sp. C0004]
MAQAVWGKSKDLAGVAMGSVALQTATVPTINLLGISAAGPTAGSWAAYAMSLYGGTVPAGGLYATAQAMAMGGTAVGLDPAPSTKHRSKAKTATAEARQCEEADPSCSASTLSNEEYSSLLDAAMRFPDKQVGLCVAAMVSCGMMAGYRSDDLQDTRYFMELICTVPAEPLPMQILALANNAGKANQDAQMTYAALTNHPWIFCEFEAGGRDFSGQHCVESILYLAETFWQSSPFMLQSYGLGWWALQLPARHSLSLAELRDAVRLSSPVRHPKAKGGKPAQCQHVNRSPGLPSISISQFAGWVEQATDEVAVLSIK